MIGYLCNPEEWLTASRFFLHSGVDHFAGKQLGAAAGKRLRMMKKDVFKIATWWNWLKKNCWGNETWKNSDLAPIKNKIRSTLVQKDIPVIRMALSLPSVSLANTDEHRKNAWIRLDVDSICLLFPWRDTFPTTTFLSVHNLCLPHVCNVMAHSWKKKKDKKEIDL